MAHQSVTKIAVVLRDLVLDGVEQRLELILVCGLVARWAVDWGQLGCGWKCGLSYGPYAEHVKEATEVVPSTPSGDSLARQFKRVEPPSLGADSATSSTGKAAGDESL